MASKAIRNDGKKTHASSTKTYGTVVKHNVLKMYRIGKHPDEIKEYLTEIEGLAPSSADDVMKAARKRVNETYEYYCKDIARTNTQRLNQIATEAYERGDYKNSLKAIDLLNKLGQLYTEKLDITQNTIRLKFD